jgi:hypothetical protein
MSKVKMRCARCSKSFRSSDARQTLCPDCAAKERTARAQKGAAQAAQTTSKSAQAPKIVGPGATLLGAAPTTVQGAPPPDRGLFGSAARAAEQEERRAREHGHAPGAATGHTSGNASGYPSGQGHGRQHEPGTGAGPHGGQQSASTAPARSHRPGHADGAGPKEAKGRDTNAPKPKAAKPSKERRPPTPPLELTAEQRVQIERRYLELALPVEYDGIRSQIATELGIPKVLVRKAVLELRQRMQLPSWWELQGFTGSASDLERIREAYAPHLPVPPIGIHKQIAERLQLEPHTVYRGIRQIRAALRLPQFNAPELHPELAHSETAAVAPASE